MADEREALMVLLAQMDRPTGCGTPLCSGSYGLEFTLAGDGVEAYTTCPCGSQSDFLPLTDGEVLHLLREGWHQRSLHAEAAEELAALLADEPQP